MKPHKHKKKKKKKKKKKTGAPPLPKMSGGVNEDTHEDLVAENETLMRQLLEARMERDIAKASLSALREIARSAPGAAGGGSAAATAT
jgi:hypothetical protein